MTNPFPRPPKFVLLTGPALSREAGFAPFDAAGLPDGVRLEDVLTPDGFARDPERVRRFYNESGGNCLTRRRRPWRMTGSRRSTSRGEARC